MRLKRMRCVAISGKMCTGKSTLLKILQSKEPLFTRVSLADPVKDVAWNYFMMPKGEKDRKLLQQIGQRFRSIRASVWIDILHHKGNLMLTKGEFPICDDVRFPNELESMRDKNWVLVRLTLPEEEQLNRIKRTYGNGWEGHWVNRNEESETSLDNIGDNEFNFVFENMDFEELNRLADDIISVASQ